MHTQTNPTLTFTFKRTGATTGDETKRAKNYIRSKICNPGRALFNNEDVVFPKEIEKPTNHEQELTYAMDVAEQRRMTNEAKACQEHLFDFLLKSCDDSILRDVERHDDYEAALAANNCTTLFNIIEYVLHVPSNQRTAILNAQLRAYAQVQFTNIPTLNRDIRTWRARIKHTRELVHTKEEAEAAYKANMYTECARYCSLIPKTLDTVTYHSWALKKMNRPHPEIEEFMEEATGTITNHTPFVETPPQPTAVFATVPTNQANNDPYEEDDVMDWYQREQGQLAGYADQTNKRPRFGGRSPQRNQPQRYPSTTHCRNWAQGRCRFGDKCRFIHEDRRRGSNSQTPTPNGTTTRRNKLFCQHCADEHGNKHANHHPRDCPDKKSSVGKEKQSTNVRPTRPTSRHTAKRALVENCSVGTNKSKSSTNTPLYQSLTIYD